MSTLKTNNIQHVDLADPSILLNSDGSVSIAGTVSYEDATNVDSVGVVTARKQLHVGTGVSIAAGGLNVTAGISTFGANIEIADKIRHNGDDNTAIRFPAADTFTIETGGTERARVDSSGDFGIGMSASGVRLDVYSSSAADIARFSGPNSAGLTIRNDTANELQLHTAPSDALIFGTNGENERLRITSDGKMGLGTSSVDELLHIANTGGGASILIETNASSGGNILFGDDSSNTVGRVQYLHSDNSMRLHTAGSERLRIASNGYIGINQTSPRNTFDVTGNIFVSNGGQIQITGTASSKGLQLIGQDDGTSLIGTMGSSGEHLLFRTGSTERMRLLVGGPHLLIGGTASVNEITESSANAGIVIGGTSFGNAGLAIINSTSGTGRIYFGDNTGSDAARNRGMIGYYHSSDFMIFSTASAERVRIDSNGDFGVGLSNPTAKLHAQDDSATVTDILKLRNYKSSVNTKPGLVFEASTTSGQGGNSYIRGLAGTDAGGADNSNDSGMEFEVRQGGSGATRKLLFMRSDGEVRLSGVFKQNATDQNNSSFTANNYYAKTFGPSSIGPGGTSTINTTNGHATGLVHIFVNRNSNAAVNRGVGYGFHLRTSGQANLGSSIYDFTGTGGAPSFTFTQANQGVYFQNNSSYTVTLRGRFELYGSVDG